MVLKKVTNKTIKWMVVIWLTKFYLFIYLFFCLATKKLDCKVKEKSWEKNKKQRETATYFMTCQFCALM